MKKGFTLVELLVVMAIISMLAGQLLPALSTAREKGREANCINNLKQFDLAITMYYQDFNEEYPPWLSVLYPSYLPGGQRKVFVCLSDEYKGAGTTTKPAHGHPGTGSLGFPEADDAADRGNFDSTHYPGRVYRNPSVEKNSYIYEFNVSKCQWFHDTYGAETITEADTNGDGEVSWKEAKLWQAKEEGYRGQVPIVRCFHHQLYNVDINKGKNVLNLAYGDHNVYLSGWQWESTVGK